MGRRKRTAGRFQVEALEAHLAPGGVSGGVLRDGLTRGVGEEIPQVQVAPVARAGADVGVLHIGEEIPQRA